MLGVQVLRPPRRRALRAPRAPRRALHRAAVDPGRGGAVPHRDRHPEPRGDRRGQGGRRVPRLVGRGRHAARPPRRRHDRPRGPRARPRRPLPRRGASGPGRHRLGAGLRRAAAGADGVDHDRRRPPDGGRPPSRRARRVRLGRPLLRRPRHRGARPRRRRRGDPCRHGDVRHPRRRRPPARRRAGVGAGAGREPVRLLLAGFGHVGRTLAAILADRAAHPGLAGLDATVVGITTGSHGAVANPAGLDPALAVRAYEAHGGFTAAHPDRADLDTPTAVATLDYDVLVELSPLSVARRGEPAIAHVRAALEARPSRRQRQQGPGGVGLPRARRPRRPPRRAVPLRVVGDGRGAGVQPRPPLPARQPGGPPRRRPQLDDQRRARITRRRPRPRRGGRTGAGSSGSPRPTRRSTSTAGTRRSSSRRWPTS